MSVYDYYDVLIGNLYNYPIGVQLIITFPYLFVKGKLKYSLTKLSHFLPSFYTFIIIGSGSAVTLHGFYTSLYTDFTVQV